ncbi:uncharacterized protein LOC142235598 [Haematobia irritans]|uniref:uncharacterized protein LOC142235598 n=1 Tax=Haematobia irritans TaxID=7368 RepID=UPI003F4F7878
MRKQQTDDQKEAQLRLLQMMDDEDATKFFKCERKLTKNARMDIKTRHKKKFKTLEEQQKRELDIKNNETWFVNLSNTQIPNDITWLLSHGKKFALPHTRETFPMLKYIADGEECIKTISDKEDQELARNKFTTMIENHTNKQQLTEREKYYLRTVEHTQRFLNHNKNLIILEADKGNVTVGMEKSDYDMKMEKIVNDIMTYRKLKSDPTNRLQRVNNELVDELFKYNIIDESEKRRMKTEIAIAPRIYGLPKIHKQDYPLRPICSSINSPSSNLCKHLTTILNRLTDNSKYNVKNSMQFKSKIQDITIDEDETMVSFDVVSLFPSIPVDLALKIIEEKWHILEEITKIPKNLFFRILKFCIIDNRYFRYKTSFYQQRKGLPMGSSASPIVADIVMEELLDRCMANCDIRPKILTNVLQTLLKPCSDKHIGRRPWTFQYDAAAIIKEWLKKEIPGHTMATKTSAF